MNELMKHEEVETAPSINPMGILQLAISQNADIDKLTKLMELQERWEANEARKAFNDALATFKENPPQITKNNHVKFNTSKGVTEYDHATLDHVCDRITKGLAAVGIAHKWKPSQDGNKITVTCILTHRMGHSEDTPLSAMPDESGGKNSIQALGSTISYLERYSLMAATGMASGMPDDDGKASGGKEMDLSEFDRIKSLIENAPTIAALKDIYLSAVKNGTAMGDQGAVREFAKAKDARKIELDGGAA